MQRHRVADGVAMKILAGVVRKWHKPLLREEVSFAFIFVEPPTNDKGQVTGPALKVAGSPVAGRCSLVTGKWYAMTEEDVVIEVAADIWERMTGPRREALLDHEVNHVKISNDSKGRVKRRDGRACLETIPDDYMINGFFDVAARHKRESMEWRQLFKLKAFDGTPQLLFEFPDEEHPDPDSLVDPDEGLYEGLYEGLVTEAASEVVSKAKDRATKSKMPPEKASKGLSTRPGKRAPKKKAKVA